jgi:uncharacterized protein (DUF58 family)
MTSEELIKKVAHIEMSTRGAVNNLFAGEYHAAFKGRGMSFAEVREYQAGDDIRDIDWNVTARLNRPYVKVFEEERELTVMLMVDISGSLDFGTGRCIQRELVAELAATLAFSATRNKDKVGLVLFSDHIEKFIPPQKGRKHVLRLIRELLEYQPVSRKTDIGESIVFLMKAMKRRCISFLISDFMDTKDFKESLLLASKKHDVVALQVYDKRMVDLPAVGLLKVSDAETGHEQYVDTNSKFVRDEYARWWQDKMRDLELVFNMCRVDNVRVSAEEDYVSALKALFSKRVRYA